MTRFRKTIAFLLLLALLPFAAAVVFSLLGKHHWALDLFTHYQQQYAVGLAVVTVAALLLKQHRIALVGGLFLLVPLSSLSYYFPPKSLPEAPGVPALRVLSFNILKSNRRHDEVLAWLREQEADVLLLLETDQEWSRTLEPLAASYPHHTGRLRSDAFGISIYSKYPLEAEQFFGSSPHTVPCLRIDIAWPASKVRLFAIHPVPPVSRRMAGNRDDYLRKFAPIIAKSEGAVIAMGDFNCSPWSTHFTQFVETSGLTDSGRKRGFASTWHRSNPLFSIPIDHILHSGHFTCTARSIGPDLGSDHRAVTATLALTDPPPPPKQPSTPKPRLRPAPKPEPSRLDPSPLQPSSLEPRPPGQRAPRSRRLPR